MPEVLASVVLVVSVVLVLAVLGLPRRGSGAPGPATAGALVAEGARTLLRLTERRHRRLGGPPVVAGSVVEPPVGRRPAPCVSCPGS